MHIDSLWKRFLKGDDRAYTELYNLYIDDLFAYGMHFTTNRESVKDCIQEVFISLYKDRSKQRKVNNIKSYLFVSLKNELFDLFFFSTGTEESNFYEQNLRTVQQAIDFVKAAVAK